MKLTKQTAAAGLALALALGISACSSDEGGTSNETTDAQTTDAVETTGDVSSATSDDMGATSAPAGDDMGATSAPAAGGAAGDACTTFFTEGGPLADRAEAGRAALEAGEVADPIALDELVLLESRIAELEEDPEFGELLTQVNEPFTAAVEAKNSEGVVDVEAGTVTLPEIDVEGSASAQAELETACQG